MATEHSGAGHAIAVGDTFHHVLIENLTRTRIVQYAGASGDFNAVHTDATYATEVAGFPSVFAHGMLTMGMTGRILTDVFGPTRIRAFGGRFVSQVWPGDTLSATATVDEILDEDGERRARVSVQTVRADGDVVFVGVGTVALSIAAAPISQVSGITEVGTAGTHRSSSASASRPAAAQVRKAAE